MFFIRKLGGNPHHIVVIHKTVQRESLIKCPWFRAKLPVQRITDLVHVVGIKTGVQTLITFIICGRIKHMVIDQSAVIPMQHFSYKDHLRISVSGKIHKILHKCPVQHIGYIQTDTVNPELIHPHTHCIQKVVSDCGVIQI